MSSLVNGKVFRFRILVEHTTHPYTTVNRRNFYGTVYTIGVRIIRGTVIKS